MNSKYFWIHYIILSNNDFESINKIGKKFQPKSILFKILKNKFFATFPKDVGHIFCGITRINVAIGDFRWHFYYLHYCTSKKFIFNPNSELPLVSPYGDLAQRKVEY